MSDLATEKKQPLMSKTEFQDPILFVEEYRETVMPLPLDPIRTKTESMNPLDEASASGPALPISPSQETERDELLRRGPSTLLESERQRLIWLLSRPSIESKATLQIQKRVPFMPR